ncbi:sialate O-acetylesterase [Rhizobium redzepovicii]|uniref:sialate O-acetylesterase n=1 Tax=Rhizobium redzepovicii TaxID=2867518 RepID=UPI001C92FAF4|nr:sialate O-acetylesterase [Rhizobium redzepovicii]MBY4589403.1 sialate O-acetylesterase [Rhizobium redzepovicii]
MAMIFGGAGLARNNFTNPDAYYIYPPGSVITGADPVLDLAGRIEVTRGNIDDRTAVIVFIGQSLSANEVPTPYVAVNTNIDQLNIYDGKLYRAKDPLLGINVSGGAVTDLRGTWMLPMADKLITAGYFDRVILVPMAVGNTRADQWASETTAPFLFNMINVVSLRLRDAGLPCTAIMWGQGESDTSANTSQASYTASMNKIIAEFNHAIPNCPILVAQESYYYGATSAAVLAAQAAVVNGTTVFAGENVDSIGSGGRYDNTHLNETGADQRATLAVAALMAALAS